MVVRPSILPVASLFVFALAMPLAAQERLITGRVLPGGQGVPFAGAAVRVTETGATVCADSEGYFSIGAPQGEVRLRVIPVGFAAQEVIVAPGGQTMEVPLGEHVVLLDEVVVVGYSGNFAGAAAGVATTTLNAKDLERVPAPTLEGAMQGKVPGAVIESNSGVPGGSYQILMRGARTIFGNAEPLVIVDGVPISNASLPRGSEAVTRSRFAHEGATNRLADVNPNDVDRVEFLKGASASALYGSRASNGVIVITTKRGKAVPKRIMDEQIVQCFRARG